MFGPEDILGTFPTLPVEKARWIHTNIRKYNVVYKGVVKGKL